MKPWEQYQNTEGPWSKYKVTDSERAQVKKEKEMDRPIEAAATSAAETATLGYLPQLEALATLGSKKLYQTIGLFPESVGAELARQEEKGNIKPQGQYTALRDIGAKENLELAKYNPKASIAGTIGGGLLQAPLMAAAAPLKGLSAVKQAAVTGAGLGAAYNPGDVEGEISGLQLGQRATGAAMGGILGGSGQKVGETVSKIPTKIAEKVTEFGKSNAFRAAGGYQIKQAKQLIGNDRLKPMADVMNREGLIQPGQSFDELLEKTRGKLGEYGQKIGQVYERVGTKPIDNNKLMADLMDGINKHRPKIGAGNYDDKLIGISDEILKHPDVVNGDIRAINEMIGDISEQINFSKANKELKPIESGLKEIRSTLRKLVDDVVQKSGSPEIKELNKTYSALKDVENLSSTRVAREQANQFLGLSDKVLGSGGLAAGAMMGDTPEERAKNMLLYGGLLGGGSKLMRSYGAPIATKAAIKTGGLLEKVPQIPQSVTTGGPSRQLLVNEMLRQKKQ